MYHLKDGLYFGRLPNGDVEVIKTTDGKVLSNNNILFRQVIECHMWSSAISSVSYTGETTTKYYTALKFHNRE